MATTAQKNTRTSDSVDPDVPHPRYQSTSRACYNSQAEVARAWAEGKYPAHNGGTLYSSDNFKGKQHSDGRGTLWHYRTREAIRTPSGLIINNSQCWSRGFAHCSHAPGADYRLPLSAIEEHTEGGQARGYRGRRANGLDAYNITGVMSEEDPRDGAYGRWRIAVVGDGETFVGIGFDRSARSGGRFTVEIPPFVKEYAESEGVVKAIVEYLRPDAVSQEMHESGLPVVTSDEYRKYRLTEEEAKAHRGAGGTTHEREYRWSGTETVNYQMYRADLQGSVIVRQGEYFFIPRPGVTTDVLEELGERNQRWALRSHKHSEPVFETDAGTLYARGRIGHTRRDHHMIDLGETWHQVERSTVDVHQIASAGTD